jgi:hypothetical protein
MKKAPPGRFSSTLERASLWMSGTGCQLRR